MTNDLAIRILTGDVLGTIEQTHEAVAMAVKALSALPSVEVVKCGECRYWDKAKYADYVTMGECERWHTARNRKDYCSDGRKKDSRFDRETSCC